MASPGGAPLSKENAAPYVLDFTVIDVNQDGKISEHEFKNACHGGWVKDPSTVKK
jgi:hypothetical protein